ncbi:unnamed protein product [Psylliodes chrysocephalus]|uniref:Myb/SANT-like DNA-binding domain-containing protein n=1 Tax=Psylliodes chrysocephalus TaxID=3402493 RepID=A0A9P0DDR4_9CUCU|nr:unnamed protein product [Psylliodes chrysocephala]
MENSQNETELSEFLCFLEKEDFNYFNSERTNALLNLYKLNKPKVGKGDIKTMKKLWEIIAREMSNKYKITVSPAKFENKYKVLERAYKKFVENNNKKKGRGRKEFVYENIFNEIFDKKMAAQKYRIVVALTMKMCFFYCKNGTSHIVYIMATPRPSSSRQKQFVYKDFDGDSEVDFDSDDSIKDRDYVESESETSLSDEGQRTIIQLKRLWDKLKRHRKGDLAEERRELMTTGGGSPPPLPPPQPEIDNLLPHLEFEINNKDDSDGIILNGNAEGTKKYQQGAVNREREKEHLEELHKVRLEEANYKKEAARLVMLQEKEK